MTSNPPRFITTLTERLVAICRPQAVLLIGSWAKGQQTLHSDVDLVLLLQRPPTHLLRAEIEDAIACVPMHVDTLLWTRRELEAASRDPYGFPASVLREARLLYGSKEIFRTTLASLTEQREN